MLKGFYNLTSGVVTHQRNLDVIANNMTNISTPGYKQDRYTATTFDEVMYSRVGNQSSRGREIGNQSYIRATSDIETDFTQGTLEETGLALDFAINGDGFFAVQSEQGEVAYTRSGSFSLDEEGYLCYPGFGRVLDLQGQPIALGTDKLYGDEHGTIYYEDGSVLGRLGVFQFADNGALERNDRGLFVGAGARAAENVQVLNKYVERSNADMIKQMTDMITFQRSLQSATQVMKMYDSLMTKATTEVGRL